MQRFQQGRYRYYNFEGLPDRIRNFRRVVKVVLFEFYESRIYYSIVAILFATHVHVYQQALLQPQDGSTPHLNVTDRRSNCSCRQKLALCDSIQLPYMNH